MRRSVTVLASKLSQGITSVLVVVVVLMLAGSQAKAGDREDAKALVGKWETQDFLGFDIEFKADGTCSYRLGSAEWEVKRGKLIIKRKLITNEYDFTITPDENTLKYDNRTWKRKK
jgi:hypothetical protein